MKKRILSAILTASMLIGLISTNAVFIEYEDIEEQKSNIYFEDIEVVELEIDEHVNIADYYVDFEETQPKATNEIAVYSNDSWNFSYTGTVQEFTAPYSGKYLLELYGAEGGGSATRGALGGYTKTEIALLEGEKVYIVVGGSGTTAGNGGYNGGGSATLGGSGGGATSVTTKNRGELKNFTSYKDEVLAVAGGGGGSYQKVLPNQTAHTSEWNGSEFVPVSYITDAYTIPGAGGGIQGDNSAPYHSASSCEAVANYPKGGTQTSGYSFGLGESGISGAGGGFYGGFAGKNYYFSGAGGSGYVKENEFTFDYKNNFNSGNGKAKITYEGEIERTIKIKTNGCGTYAGKEEATLHCVMGEEVHLSNIELKDGYRFVSFVDYEGNKQESSFIMGKENLELSVLYYAPLFISTEKEGENTIRIEMIEEDDIEKYYKVFQSKDGIDWYDAALSADAINGKPLKNRTYSPGSYIYTTPITGDYRIRLYGGQGGNANSPYGTGLGGKGAYTEGIITLEKGTKLYINIGSAGRNGNYDASLASYAWGGKASDIRIKNNGINDRIMVAAGGGAGAAYFGYIVHGSAGGALTSGGAQTICATGKTSTNPTNYASNSTGATQTRGGYYTYNNTAYNYGSGTVYASKEAPAGSGGGYGYWCGAAGGCTNNVGAGTGGSSYISGYSGCVTFPNYVFRNTVMTAGTRSGSGYGYIDLLTELPPIYDGYMNEVYFFDTKAPNAPSNGSVEASGTNLSLSWQDNGDNGEKYYHKVESYEKSTDKLINTSEILEEYLEAGVKGYYYFIDTNKTGTATASHNFVESNSIQITRPSSKSYIHISAVDNANNISATYTYEIPSIVNYTIKYYKMDKEGKYVLDKTITETATIGQSVTPTIESSTGFKTPASQTKTIQADGKTEFVYYYERNKYSVIYIDKNSQGTELGRTQKQVFYETDVRGSDIGSSQADNAYYPQYRYVSDTSGTVGTNTTTVYRIFEFCETEKESHLTWNDNNNADGLRPSKYTLKLKQNGKVIDEIELPSSQTDYTFENLPKYDTNGNLYKYELDTIASERYKFSIDENGNLIVEDYLPASFSVKIPKSIVLDGKTGNADYTVTVNGTFYYNDILTVKPDSSFVMTDRSSISSMQANIIQIKTGFSKEDLPNSTANGHIQVNRTYFSGLWQGTYHFNIKFKMSN